MAFTGNFMCTSFKKELLEGVHDFRLTGGDTFKIALYSNSASFTAATSAYTSTNEVANGNGYTTGGNTLTRVDPATSSTTAYTDFADSVWSTASFTARGALVYNTTPAHTYTNPTCIVLDFGSDKTATSGDFTVIFPTADATNAIIRIA
jgi:hypothetical protein